MMMFWAWAGVPLGVYNIVSDFNIALQIQPQILSFLSLMTWIQCYHYEKHWTILHSLVVVIPIASVMAGIEAGLIFALRVAVNHHVHWPVTFMAVLAALFLALGVLSHYVDIYRHRTVRGISFLFIGIDALGDLTSIISVIFQPKLEVLGLVIYSVELVLWLGVFACGGYYNLIPWMEKKISKLRTTVPPTVQEDVPTTQHQIALHEMPSSTSVFRTPSSDIELRSRTTMVSNASAA